MILPVSTYDTKGMRSQFSASGNSFWDWWWPSITSYLPIAIRARLIRTRPLRILHWSEAGIEPEVSVQRSSDAVMLVLPKQLALIRSLRLPSSAWSRLREIVHFEVERLTPFSPDQVYFDVVVQRTSRTEPSLDASLVVVPRQAFDHAVEAARTFADRLVAVDVADASGERLGANLLPVFQRSRPLERWRRWNIALALVCSIAIFGFLAGIANARKEGTAFLQEHSNPLFSQARSVKAREAALKQAAAPSDHSKVGSATNLALLTQLSAALPLDSYLIHIEISKGVIATRGQTSDLNAVLTSLRSSPYWDPPELTGSRTLPDGSRQEFSLRLRLRLHEQTATRAR